uniref:Rhodanese domain-containing protein n=1 Tax=Arion vulgaris TaxID=1028688 RepID=A0A0B6Y8F9_9EUPU
MQRAFGSTLVTVKGLNDIIKLNISKRSILDASWHLPSTGRNAKLEYSESHIPGAVFFDIDECSDKSTELPHMVPSAQIFESYVGALGISNDTHVIVYDNHPQFPIFSAQRVWWTFRLFGHNNISILEGGLPKWTSEGGTVTSQPSNYGQEIFQAQFNPKLIKSYEDIKRNIENPEFILVDARSEERFKGVSSEPRPDTKSGCILHSINLPFVKLMNLEQRTMKPVQELQQIFQDAGVDLTKDVVATCGSGVTACLLALAGHLCNNDDIAVYDGSWTEWFTRAPPHLKSNIPI